MSRKIAAVVCAIAITLALAGSAGVFWSGHMEDAAWWQMWLGFVGGVIAMVAGIVAFVTGLIAAGVESL